jgi:hypothetical protein
MFLGAKTMILAPKTPVFGDLIQSIQQDSVVRPKANFHFSSFIAVTMI